MKTICDRWRGTEAARTGDGQRSWQADPLHPRLFAVPDDVEQANCVPHLAQDFRLMAMDIRGHGLSDKPCDVYGDSKLWADDIQAHHHDTSARTSLCSSDGPTGESSCRIMSLLTAKTASLARAGWVPCLAR